MVRLLLIRHATTNAVGKKLSGRLPGVHLNEEGLIQAEDLAERLKGLPITSIFSSPLERAIETAAPLARSLKIKTITNEDFLEINFGEWTDQSFEELSKSRQFELFNVFRSNVQIPGGESMQDAQNRMINGIQKLYREQENETLAIVSHSDLIKATIAYYAGIHLDMFQRIEICPASVSIIELYDETARINLVNHTGAIKI